jgi:hypothetical protein
MMLTPAALFVYITGQISAIVVLAALVAAGELTRLGPGQRRWLVAIGLVVTTLKPNIIWLPVLLMTLEILRRRDWRTVAMCIGVMIILTAISFVWLPDWPVSLLLAWRAGAYRGGVGLVAAGYIGLIELGVPLWVFVPFVLYLFRRWWHASLSRPVLALAFAMCLLVTPYSRSYDHVILILPSIASLAGPAGITRYLRFALIIAAWLAPLLTLAVLAPVLTTLAVLLAFPPPRVLANVTPVRVPNA